MPLARLFPLVPALVACALVACAPLPDTGADPAKAGPAPPLVPLDDVVRAPEPLATPESAEALAERGAALKAEAAAID